MNCTRRQSLLMAVVLGLLPASMATAQPTPVPNAKPPAAAPGVKNVQITEQVKAAFAIDPIVNRVEARRGKVLNLEWKIVCEGDAVNLDIRPVALTQDLNGGIFPNNSVPAPPDLQLTSPGQVTVNPGESFTITARLRVPDENSTFHTFGVLVRDSGQLKDKPGDVPQDGPRVRIKFITQYLLRADVTVQGVRAESAAKLKIESAELVDVNGIPVARAYVTNPTEGPIEFSARMQIRASEESDERPTFPLSMPVRATMDPPDRYVARILAGARIRVENPLPKPVFPGEYYIETTLLNDSRPLVKSGFPVDVKQGEYPAQGIAIVQTAPGILVAPSQIELSLQRGGSRAEVITFSNEGSKPAEVDLSPESWEGQPLDWATVRPAKLTLLPGTSRKVSITLSAGGDTNTHQYGRLRVKSTVDGQPTGDSTAVIVAGLGRAINQPVLEAGDIRWDTDHGTPAFAIDLKNTGPRHAVANGTLVLGNEAGTTFEIRGGFGKWVLPGATETLRFNPPKNLAAGHYTARLSIPTGETTEPIQRNLEIDLAP